METVNNLISIIIPVYNRQNYIEECIQSVFKQSYQNYEIIIVDDGSSDNTLSICKALADLDPRVKVLEAGHGGVSAARNIALDATSGEYIFFLDSDDVIYPLLLETLVTAMQNSNATIGGTHVCGISEANWCKVREKLEEMPQPSETTFLSHEETIESALCHNSPLACIGGVMMHRDLIGATRFRTDLYIGEDFFFIYENLIKGASAVFLKQRWYYVRHHKNNSSWDYSFNGFWTRFYRRVLVWRSEDSLGRKKYADTQRRGAFGIFLKCFTRNRPYGTESTKMRNALKEYKAEMLTAFTFTQRLVFYLFLYFPATAWWALKVRRLLSSKKRNRGGHHDTRAIR